MKRIVLLAITLILSFSAIHTNAQELDQNLELLKPFLNKIWISEMEGLRGEGAIISEMEWKIVWDGKVVKYTSQTEKLNVITEGYFFWDPVKQEIGLFTLNNKGRFLQGHVKKEDGKILMYGYITLGDSKLKFKNYFEFSEDGKISDNWYRFKDNQWLQGHSVILYPKSE